MNLENLEQYLLSFNIFNTNDYFKKYIALIDKNRFRKKEKYKTNLHHIIPRSYYYRNNLQVDNSELNTVNLLYKDHILAHYYLCLCLSDNKLKWDSEYSIRFILNNKNFKASDNYLQEKQLILSLDNYQELYEDLKIHIGNVHKCKTLSKEHRKILSEVNKAPKSAETKLKISKARLGMHLSDETKLKLSNINKGKKLSENTKNKISENSKINPNYGMKNKKLSEESKKILSDKAKKQWSSVKAREEQSIKQKSRGFKWYNNGLVCIQINKWDDVPEGFIPGRLYRRKKEEIN